MLPPTCFGCFCLISLTFLAGLAMAQSSGDSASGTLQVAKARFTLQHVFAVMEDDPFSNGEKEILTVLLSDVPVPADKRKASNEWRIWVGESATTGAIHGLILSIDPARKVWDGGHVLTRSGFMFFTEQVSGDATRNLHFELSGAIGERVAGKVSMKEPMTGMSDEDGPWRVEAQFSSAIVRRPAVSAQITGEAARTSPQYKAARAYFEACRKKDVEAIRAAVEPGSRDAMTQMFSGPNKEDALNMFAQMAAEALSFKLERITVRGDSADLEFKGTNADSSSSQIIHMALSGGEWKITR
jgi:hypothetical protein